MMLVNGFACTFPGNGLYLMFTPFRSLMFPPLMSAFSIVSALSDKSLGGRPDTIRNGVKKQVAFDA